MPKVKVKKFAIGGRLSFNINDENFDIDEQSLDEGFEAWLNSDPRLRKDESNLRSTFSTYKDALKKGATSGNLLSINTGEGGVTGVTDSNGILTNTQRGYDEEGNVAKPRFLSSVTGLRSDDIRNSAVGKFITDAASKTYLSFNKERQAIKEKEKIELDNLAAEQKARSEKNESDRKSKLYGDVIQNLDLGTTYYGKQAGSRDDNFQTNYSRYHSDQSKQRESDLAYLNRLKTEFGNAELLNNSDFNDIFTKQMPIDFTKFSTALNNLNLEDKNLDIQKAFDSLGLGTQYSKFRDRRLFDAQVATQNNGQQTEESSQPVSKFGYNPTHPTGVSEDGQVDYDSRNGVSALKYARPYEYNGRSLTAQEYIDLYENDEIDKTSDVAGQMYNLAKRDADTYSSLINNLVNDTSNSWRTFDRQNIADETLPYTDDSSGLDDIDSTLDITSKFSKSKGKNGYDFSVVNERLRSDDGSVNIRTRYTDKDGSHYGYYTIDDDNLATFHAVDNEGNEYKTIPMGKSQEGDGGNAPYSWKQAQLNKSWKTLTTKGMVEQGAKERNKRLQTITSWMPEGSKVPMFYKKGGRFAEGGEMSWTTGVTVRKPTPKKSETTQQSDKVKTTTSKDGKVEEIVGKAKRPDVVDMFSSDYKLSEADKLELGALASDFAGLAAEFAPVPIAQQVAIAGTGVAATYMSNRAAELRGEKISGWSQAGDYALDLAAAIPFVGIAAKAPKVLKKMERGLEIINRMARGASASSGIVQLFDALTAFSNGDRSVENIRKVLGGFRGLNAARTGTKGTVRDEKLVGDATFNGKLTSGEKVSVTIPNSKAKEISQMKFKDQRKAISELAAKQGIEGDIKFDKKFSALFGKTPLGKHTISNAVSEETKRYKAGFGIGKGSSDFNARRLMTDEEIAAIKNPLTRLWARNSRGIARRGGYYNTDISKTTPFKNMGELGFGERSTYNNKINMGKPHYKFEADGKTVKSKTYPKASIVPKGALGIKLPSYFSPYQDNIKLDINKPLLTKPFTLTGNAPIEDGFGLAKRALNPSTNASQRFQRLSPIINLNGYTPPKEGVAHKVNAEGQALEDIRKTLPIKANPVDISELGRALYNRSTASKIDTRMTVPLVSNVQEIYSPIKQNLALKTAYDSSANRLRTAAGQAFSNDAGVEAARRLSANAQAEDILSKGVVSNAQDLANQEAQDLAARRQYASGRSAVANQNVNSLAQKEQYERGMNNQKLTAMNTSIDNYWANQNMKSYRNQELSRDLTAKLNTLDFLDSSVDKLNLNVPEISGMSISAASRVLNEKIAPLAMKEYQTGVTPTEKAELDRLRGIAASLEQAKGRVQLNSYKDLLGGKENLLNIRYGNRVGLDRAVTDKHARGGKMSMSDRKEFEVFKYNMRAQNDWLKTYNKWIDSKSKVDKGDMSATTAGLNNILKNVYAKGK